MRFQAENLYKPQQQQSLNAKLEAAGCVFQFRVWQWPDSAPPALAEHQVAVETFFQQIIRPQYDDLRRRTIDHLNGKLRHIKANPNPKSFRQDCQRLQDLMEKEEKWLTLLVEPEKMSAVRLPGIFPKHDFETAFREHQDNPEAWGSQLCRQFRDPPYGLDNVTEKDTLDLWLNFCTMTGLDTDAEIYDWIQHQAYSPDHNETQIFSNYFNDGLE